MGFVSALLYALLMNVVPLIEVIATGRSPGVLLLLYWFETVLMVVTGAVRIVLHRRGTDRAGHYASTATTADHAALFCALNPFVAAALGAVCFHEHFGLAGLLGGALILAGIVVSCWPQKTGG